MSQSKKPKKFLNLPEYPGGKKAFNTYITQHLQYPEEALKAGVQGDVLVTYEVNDNGEVLSPKVKHGIGHGCDQEAIRLISSLKFASTQNRGVRVMSRFTTRIPFRLPKKIQPQTSIQYTVKPAAPPEVKPAEPTPKTGYTWQISIKPHGSQT